MTNDEVFRHSCFGILSPFVICASSFSSLIQECEHEIAFGNDSVIHHTAAMRFRKPIAARFDQFRVNEKRVAWKNWFAKLHVISANDMTANASADERKVADDIENFVPREFVGKTQRFLAQDGVTPNNNGVFQTSPFNQVFLHQRRDFLVENKSARRRNFAFVECG